MKCNVEIKQKGMVIQAYYKDDDLFVYASNLGGTCNIPLYYCDNNTPVLGLYRKGHTHTKVVSHLIYNWQTNQLASEFFCRPPRKRKITMYHLLEVVPTRCESTGLFLV